MRNDAKVRKIEKEDCLNHVCMLYVCCMYCMLYVLKAVAAARRALKEKQREASEVSSWVSLMGCCWWWWGVGGWLVGGSGCGGSLFFCSLPPKNEVLTFQLHFHNFITPESSPKIQIWKLKVDSSQTWVRNQKHRLHF